MEVVAWYFPTLEDVDADVAHLQALADYPRPRRAVRRARARHRVHPDGEERRRPQRPRRRDRGADPQARGRHAADRRASCTRRCSPRSINPASVAQVPVQAAGEVASTCGCRWRTGRSATARTAIRTPTPKRASAGCVRTSTTRRLSSTRSAASATRRARGDYEAFLRAVYDTKSVGWSIYDYNTMASSAWPRMRTGGVPTTTTTTTTTHNGAPPRDHPASVTGR